MYEACPMSCTGFKILFLLVRLTMSWLIRSGPFLLCAAAAPPRRLLLLLASSRFYWVRRSLLTDYLGEESTSRLIKFEMKSKPFPYSLSPPILSSCFYLLEKIYCGFYPGTWGGKPIPLGGAIYLERCALPWSLSLRVYLFLR